MEVPPGLQEAAPGGAAVAVGDSEKIAELLRSERGGMRLTAVGIVDEKIGDVAVKLAEDIPFAALEQHLLNPDGWQALAKTLLGEPSARVGYLVKASLLKAWWEDATPEQPPTKASAPTAASVPVAGESPITRPAATLSAKYAKELEGQGLDEPVSAKIGEGYVQKKGPGAKGAAASPVTKTITKKAPATPTTPKKAPAKKAAGGYLFQGTAPSKSGGKFWRIKVAGKKFTTEYGKVGKEKAGFRSSTKEFATAAEATKEAEKLIKRKSKDYS